MSSFPARLVFRTRATTAGIFAGIRTLWWRALGMRVGRGTLLPPVTVTWPHQVSLGAGCTLEHDIYFKYDGIWEPGPSIIIGDRSFIGAGCEFNVRKRVQLGADCLISSGCKFIDHDHAATRRHVPIARQMGGAEAAIILEEDIWLGVNVVVLKGVTIGRGSIVAAGAVVTRSIDPHEIWAGVPARKIGERPGASE